MPDNELGLLLLHALPFDSEMWSAQIPLLPNHTYAPNLYEFGSSIEVWAEKSLSLCQEKRLVVVGCSVGASCALKLAKLAPDRIAALVLIGAKTKHNPDSESYRNALQLLDRQGAEAAWKTYWETLFHLPDDKAVIPAAKDMTMRQSKAHLSNGLSAFHTRPSREDFVADCNFPIHIITGDQDTLPGPVYSRRLTANASDGYFHIIKSCGHYVPLSKPNELNEILINVINTAAASKS